MDLDQWMIMMQWSVLIAICWLMHSQALKIGSLNSMQRLLAASVLSLGMPLSNTPFVPPMAYAQEVTQVAQVANNKAEVDVYFGIGCFWHVQHEFVEAERRILNRPDDKITV